MIDGLDIFPDFIGERDEETLLARYMDMPIARRHAIDKHDRYDQRKNVMRFGAKTYADRVVSLHVPTWLDALCFRLKVGGIVADKPNSVTINEYAPGQGLGLHLDKPDAGEEICILSLLSEASIRFELILGSGTTYVFPRRALLRMRGPARHEYQHELLPVLNHRISIVFRHKEETS